MEKKAFVENTESTLPKTKKSVKKAAKEEVGLVRISKKSLQDAKLQAVMADKTIKKYVEDLIAEDIKKKSSQS